MRRLFLISSFMFLAVSACQTSALKTIDNNENLQKLESVQPEGFQYSGLSNQAPDAYQVMFIIEYTGSEYEWEYQLTTRKNNEITEYYFYMEGIEGDLNPGAVRLVTDGDSSWMIGPGTDELCFRFPNSLELGPAFLTPDNFFDPEYTNQTLIEAGFETTLGQETTHYSVKEGQLTDWTDLSIDLWATDAGVILKYLGNAMGEDPLFNAGYGFFNFSYIISEIGEQVIEPILGCEIDYPVPENIRNITRFPGLVSFDSEDQVNDLVDFYLQSMKNRCW